MHDGWLRLCLFSCNIARNEMRCLPYMLNQTLILSSEREDL